MEAAHGPEHPDVAAVLSHFAAALHQQVRLQNVSLFCVFVFLVC